MAQIARTEADKAASSAKDAGGKIADKAPYKPRTLSAADSSLHVRRSMPGPRWRRRPLVAPMPG